MIQMTRAQYQAKYGVPPGVTPAPAPASTPAQAAKPSLGQKILNAGTSVANFVGAKGISEQFGADIARMRAPADQKNLINYPSMKSVVGSGMQFGANFIPGAGVGAGIARKVATGAATGYAMDVGSKLQHNNTLKEAAKPGLGTAIGAALPIAGKLTGLSNVATKAKKAAVKLEESSLKMTPVDKQNLARQGKDIANFLSQKKLVGTPDQRYAKVAAMNDDMERQVTRVIDSAKVNIPKHAVLDEIKKIPDKYVDNLSEYDSVVAKVERIMETLKKNKGDVISGSSLNAIKRAEWDNAYAKNNTDVINEVSSDVGHIIKGILDKSIKGLEPLNKEYGMLIAAKRQLFKATSRPQAGLLGKAVAMAGGSAIGGAIGGPLGLGVGAYAAPQIANAISTPVRSTLGAGMQISSEAIKRARLNGAIQPVRKAILQGVQNSRRPSDTPLETGQPLPQSIQQSSPNPTKDPATVNEDGSITMKGPMGSDVTVPFGIGGGTIGKKAAVTAADMMKDSLLSMLRKGAPKLSNAINPQLADDTDEFIKFLEETRNPTIAQMNKGLEILRRQGHDVTELSNRIIKATRAEYEQARDIIGRYAKGKKH